MPLSAVAAKGLAGLRIIRSGKPRGIFIIVISTKALLELCERCLSNHYRIDRGNIETTCIALRRYGHADSVTLFSIFLSRLLLVQQRKAKYNNFTDTDNRILARGQYLRSEAPHSSNVSSTLCRAKELNGRLGEVQTLKHRL